MLTCTTFASQLRLKLSTPTKPRDPAIKAATVRSVPLHPRQGPSRNHVSPLRASVFTLHTRYSGWIRGLYCSKPCCRKVTELPTLCVLPRSCRAAIGDWNVKILRAIFLAAGAGSGVAKSKGLCILVCNPSVDCYTKWRKRASSRST